MPLKRQQPNRTESARVTAFTFKTIPQGAATTACSGIAAPAEGGGH